MQPPTKDADKITFSFSPAFLSIHVFNLKCEVAVEKKIKNCFVAENGVVLNDKMRTLGEMFKLAEAQDVGGTELKDVDKWKDGIDGKRFKTEFNRKVVYYFGDYKEIEEIQKKDKNIPKDKKSPCIDVTLNQLTLKNIPKQGQNFILAMVSQCMGRLVYDLNELRGSIDGGILDSTTGYEDELGLYNGLQRALYGRMENVEQCLKKMQIVDYNTETGDVIIKFESKKQNGDVYSSASCVLNLKNHTYGWENVEFTYDKKDLDPTALKEITGKYGEPDSNGVVKFQTPEDIKAEKFISDVEKLAKKSGSDVDKQNLNIIAQTLKSLMRDMPTCLSKPEFRKQQIDSLKQAVLDVKDLKIEKLSWKNVLNVFLFIPSLYNLITTGGMSFWIRSSSSRIEEEASKVFPQYTEPNKIADKEQAQEPEQEQEKTQPKI